MQIVSWGIFEKLKKVLLVCIKPKENHSLFFRGHSDEAVVKPLYIHVHERKVDRHNRWIVSFTVQTSNPAEEWYFVWLLISIAYCRITVLRTVILQYGYGLCK